MTPWSWSIHMKKKTIVIDTFTMSITSIPIKAGRGKSLTVIRIHMLL
jgi:hypothetical protein